MADWTDGPEYAPHERPDAFVASAGGTGTATLAAAPVDAAAAAPAPTERPDYSTPDAAPLDHFDSPAADARDPHEAFAVTTTPLTAPPAAQPALAASQPLTLSTQPTPAYESAPGTTTGQLPQARWDPPTDLPPHVAVPQASAWGSAHAAQSAPRPVDPWAPQQPLALPNLPAVNLPPGAYGPPAHVNPQSFPTQDAAQWYATYGTPPPVPQLGPVTAKALVTASDPVVLACLLAGGLLPFLGLAWTAPPLLVVAMVLATQRIRYRRTMVKNTFMRFLGVAVVLAGFGMVDSYAPGLLAWWESFCGWSQFACWALIPTLLMVVGGALRRGEQPES
jgi:hypothetical protein